MKKPPCPSNETARFATGFTTATALAVAPDGRIVTAGDGKVVVHAPDGNPLDRGAGGVGLADVVGEPVVVAVVGDRVGDGLFDLDGGRDDLGHAHSVPENGADGSVQCRSARTASIVSASADALSSR